MTTNVNSEFISKVLRLSESMRDLASFWQDNSEVLEDLNVCKDYPFSESFDDLTLGTCSWFLTLVSEYYKKTQK